MPESPYCSTLYFRFTRRLFMYLTGGSWLGAGRAMSVKLPGPAFVGMAVPGEVDDATLITPESYSGFGSAQLPGLGGVLRPTGSPCTGGIGSARSSGRSVLPETTGVIASTPRSS